MKKSLILVMVLLLLAIGGVFTVNAHLLEKRDAVLITEKVVYGDKSIVEGVTVLRNTKYDDHIRWKTTYVAGEEAECYTEYDFSASGKFTDYSHIPSGVEVYANHIRNFDRIENSEELRGLEIAYKELLDEAEPGERLDKTVSLADYQEYYILELMLDLPENLSAGIMDEADIRNTLKNDNLNETYRTNLEKSLEMIETIQELFKIPVLENHIYRIAVEKDLEGKLYSWGYSSVNGGGSSNGMELYPEELPEDIDGFFFSMISTMSDDTCYFTFNTRTQKDKIVDTSKMPQGYGIYAFGFDTETSEIDIVGMKNIYSLNPNVYVTAIELDKQQENLLIFTEDGNEQILTVVDLTTMEQKQQITYANETGAYGAYIYEDFMVVRYTWEKFVVLSKNSDGSYTKEYVINIEDNGAINLSNKYPYGNYEFDWDGEKLLLADTLIGDMYHYNEECGFYLAVFDEHGLQYYGEYESSLDTGKEYIDYFYNCMPTDIDPLKVTW